MEHREMKTETRPRPTETETNRDRDRPRPTETETNRDREVRARYMPSHKPFRQPTDPPIPLWVYLAVGRRRRSAPPLPAAAPTCTMQPPHYSSFRKHCESCNIGTPGLSVTIY